MIGMAAATPAATATASLWRATTVADAAASTARHARRTRACRVACAAAAGRCACRDGSSDRSACSLPPSPVAPTRPGPEHGRPRRSDSCRPPSQTKPHAVPRRYNGKSLRRMKGHLHPSARCGMGRRRKASRRSAADDADLRRSPECAAAATTVCMGPRSSGMGRTVQQPIGPRPTDAGSVRSLPADSEGNDPRARLLLIRRPNSGLAANRPAGFGMRARVSRTSQNLACERNETIASQVIRSVAMLRPRRTTQIPNEQDRDAPCIPARRPSPSLAGPLRRTPQKCRDEDSMHQNIMRGGTGHRAPNVSLTARTTRRKRNETRMRRPGRPDPAQ